MKAFCAFLVHLVCLTPIFSQNTVFVLSLWIAIEIQSVQGIKMIQLLR